MSMSNPVAARHFIIAREGMAILVREIESGSDVTFSRDEAWDLAQRMAKPAKAAKDRRAKAANSIEFVGIDGMRTVVRTESATQDAYEAELRGERAEVATTKAKPAPVNADAPIKWVDLG